MQKEKYPEENFTCANASVQRLIDHVISKIQLLPRLAKDFDLGEEEVCALRRYLRHQLNQLLAVSAETAEDEVTRKTDKYFKSNTIFWSMVYGEMPPKETAR
jgi:hypothetical protein